MTGHSFNVLSQSDPLKSAEISVAEEAEAKVSILSLT
jgi:hypothetical protein